MLKKLLQKQESELSELEMIIQDGELKDCVCYHEATKDLIRTQKLELLEAVIEEVETSPIAETKVIDDQLWVRLEDNHLNKAGKGHIRLLFIKEDSWEIKDTLQEAKKELK